MIVDKIENVSRYKEISSGISKALDILQEKNLEGLKPGTYEIQGKDIYAILKEYVPSNSIDGPYELHRKYIDLFYYIQGGEAIGYCPAAGLKESVPYNQESDCSFFEASGSLITMKPGMFMIAFPSDAHRPEIPISSEKVKKLIIKIRA